jgi:hypothetical protein
MPKGMIIVVRLIKEWSYAEDDWSTEINGYYICMFAEEGKYGGERYVVEVYYRQGGQLRYPETRNTYPTEEAAMKRYKSLIRKYSKIQ